MKNIFKIIVITLISTFIYSCNNYNTGESVKVTNAKSELKECEVEDYQVVKLFTLDNITVYRFYDNGYYRYFTSTSEMIKDDEIPNKNDNDVAELSATITSETALITTTTY